MERGSEERNQLNNYNLQISSAAAATNNIHHELGFIHFADHNNLTFLPPSSQSSHSLQAAAAASVSVTPSAAVNTNAAAAAGAGGLGFSHSQLLVNRPSWNNNEQVNSNDSYICAGER